MDTDKLLTFQEITNIVNEIIEEEMTQSHINIKFSPLTIRQYYKSDTFKQSLKLEKSPLAKLSKLLCPLTQYSWYDSKSGNIFLILDNYRKMIENKELWFIIMTPYHEARHKYQIDVLSTKNDYLSFLLRLEIPLISLEITKYITISVGQIHYDMNHDKFMIEIDANNYATSKTINHLQKYPELYESNKKKLNERKIDYEHDLEIYDAYSMFAKYDFLLKKYPSIMLNFIDILKYFYNEDGSFKTLSEILKNRQNIDEKIMTLILSSQPFLEQLDFDSLIEEEQVYILMIVKKAYNYELQRQEKLQNFKIKDKKEFKYYLRKIKRILLNSINLRRIWYKFIDSYIKKFEKKTRQKHQETISRILAKEH